MPSYPQERVINRWGIDPAPFECYLSTHTKKYIPWRPIYLEGYANEDDAKDREVKLKQFGKVYSQLKRRVQRSLRH